jgi:TldD protein
MRVLPTTGTAVRGLAAAVVIGMGCAPAGQRAVPVLAKTPAAQSGGQRARSADPPPVVRVEPLSGGGGGEKAAGLVALEQELARAMAALGQAKPPPYFMAYRVNDVRDLSIQARNGALVSSAPTHTRVLETEVRVGDYRFDSSRPSRSVAFPGQEAALLPRGDDEPALRAVAWRETDRAYKAAVDRYSQLRAQRAVKVDREDNSDDFSRERPVVFLESRQPLEIDVPAWEERVRRLSARFRSVPEIQFNEVAFSATNTHRWMVTSEGTMLQTAAASVKVNISASTRADDGMDLQRDRWVNGAGFEGFPGEEALGRLVDEAIADLRALRKAPVAEPYVGPAIFEGPAAGVFFHEAFGHRTEGFRLREDDEAQTFARKMGQPLMPAFISVYDDPSLRKLGDVELNGFYRFDEEGVPAQRVALVDKGILRGFLLGRAPVRGFPRSNGHGRGRIGRRPDARMANLVVQSSEVVSAAELRRRLLAEVGRQGRPYGLLFKDIAGGRTQTGRGSERLKVQLVMVYRVWPDGRPDELVRGADLAGTPLTVLTKVLAASDSYGVFNGACDARSGWIPQTNISPSLLVGEVEIERKAKGQDRPPVLPPPPVAGALP